MHHFPESLFISHTTFLFFLKNPQPLQSSHFFIMLLIVLHLGHLEDGFDWYFKLHDLQIISINCHPFCELPILPLSFDNEKQLAYSYLMSTGIPLFISIYSGVTSQLYA